MGWMGRGRAVVWAREKAVKGWMSEADGRSGAAR